MFTRRRLFWLKLTVTLGLLSWLGVRMLERDGISMLVERLETLHVGWLTLAIALHFVAVLAGVLRWRLLLSSAEITLPLAWLTRSFLIGRFVGAFTPSTSGLDGWRAVDAGRASGRMARSATVIGIEKLVGIVGMSTASAALIPFGGLELLGETPMLGASMMAIAACLGLASLRWPDWMRVAEKRLPRFLAARVTRLVDALVSTPLRGPDMIRAVGLSIACHLALSAVFFATARSLGITIDAGTLLMVGNAIVLAVLLPISIGGVGVREGVAVALLGAASVSSTDAVLVALLGYLTGQLPALLGALAMAQRRRLAPIRSAPVTSEA